MATQLEVPRSRRRVPALALVLSFVALSLCGCLRLDLTMDINDQDRVSGRFVIAATPSRPDDMGPVVQVPPGMDQLVAVEPYDEDGYVGTLLTFQNLTFEQLQELTSTGPDPTRYRVSLRQIGENLSFNTTMDLSKVREENADIKIAITFPAEVHNTNGRVEGKTVTWRPRVGELNTLRASLQHGGAGDTWLLGSLIVGGLTGGASVAVGALALRSHRFSRRLVQRDS
ncbi:DUF3153 domain-containing protein [Actinoalloteichus hymeniacidonis]|uniref:DUF3153 family protein n=1 Tax=Actinoalloteichus hymeniacidonis TaxID=340345 RepID=A0AAC9HU08_9PSEU|nr:DUF3153 domain-containing protein [Actinoalloteichus hymeniacidonis]AOS65096.1 putative DUF3153 family protein [Actinoalloteichus hymeniacidonis]MBB5906825.1 hypothetical protein [Actinoalloteichus hymeniacidonis]